MGETPRGILAWTLFLFFEMFVIAIVLIMLFSDECMQWIVMGTTMILVNCHGNLIFFIMPGIQTLFVKYVNSLIVCLVTCGCSLCLIIAINENTQMLFDLPLFGLFTLSLYTIQVMGAIFVYIYMQSIRNKRGPFALDQNLCCQKDLA